MKKVPIAKLALKDFSNTALLAYAIKVNTALSTTPGSTNFTIPAAFIQPGPATIAPATPTFGNQINTYKAALGAAYKGSKVQTAAKNAAKQAIIQTLQIYWEVVNETARATTGDYQGYPALEALVLTSGFSTIDGSDRIGPLDAPMIRSIESPAPGQIKILLNKFSKSGKQRTKKVPGVNVYEVRYRTAAAGAIPAGPWQTFVSSAYFMTIEDLNPGTKYDIIIKAIGADSISAETAQRSIVVI